MQSNETSMDNRNNNAKYNMYKKTSKESLHQRQVSTPSMMMVLGAASNVVSGGGQI